MFFLSVCGVFSPLPREAPLQLFLSPCCMKKKRVGRLGRWVTACLFVLFVSVTKGMWCVHRITPVVNLYFASGYM